MYFVSSVLRDARERYPEIQKLLLGVLIASRKLRHYFEAHRITVVTSYPLERVLHNRSATGRIAEWSLELSGFDLHFANTTSIKSRALADFIAEWTPTPGTEEEAQSSLPGNEDPECWTMYFDGSFSLMGAGAGVLLISPTGERLKYLVQMLFDEGQATNNTAEYEGLLAGLRAAAGLGIKRLIVRGDSQLVINQVTKEYECPQMAAYVDAVRRMEHRFSGLQFEHVPRAMNEVADQLSKIAARREPAPPGAFVERLSRPSIAPAKPEPRGAPCPDEGAPPAMPPTEPGSGPPGEVPLPGKHAVLAADRQALWWAEELLQYLQHGLLPGDDNEAERIARQAKMYVLIDGDLYRRRENGVKLRCIDQVEGRHLLADIHEGMCASHIASRALVGKAFRQGFYWPTALGDAEYLVKTCDACQFHAKNINQPAQALQTIPLSWPFAVWGLDILGPFPRSVGGYLYLFVAIDKFTKWPEVEPVRTITAQVAVKFIKGIVCRFGVPNRIITDNGTQFTSSAFMSYCEEMGTKICFASVAHPRSNGQAERANAEVLRGLKTKSFDRLEACGKNWVDEVPLVLWSIRTTPSKATGETPFSLVYGAEAVLPTELKYGSPRVRAYDEATQGERRVDDVNFLEEVRCRAAMRAARYQQGLRRYHSRHVRPRKLEEGDLVLRRIQSRGGMHKLSPKWEGPFRVTHVSRPGAVRLETEEGMPVANSWNIEHLQKYHLRKFYP